MNLSAGGLPHRLDLLHRFVLGLLHRGENDSMIAKQLSESSVHPAPLGAGDGVGRNQPRRDLPEYRSRVLEHTAFRATTSVMTAWGARLPIIAFSTARMAPRGAATTIISAPETASDTSVLKESMTPRRWARSRLAGLRLQPVIALTARASRSASASEPPINPTPMMHRRSITVNPSPPEPFPAPPGTGVFSASIPTVTRR